MEDTRQSAPNMEEIDLLKLAKSVWRKRAFILKAAAVGAVVGVVVAFSIPREYTTTVKMAPEGVKTSAAGGMADLAAMAGINLGGQNQSGDGINLMLYPDIVSSTPFIVEMSQIPVRGKEMPSPVSLYDYVDQELSAPWWSHVVGAPMRLIGWIFSSEDGDAAEALNPYALSREQSLVLNALQHRIAISVDKKTGVITATATMQDPLVAAQAADSMVGKLEAYMSEYRTEKAKRDLAFTQNLFDEARQQYYEAQQRYARPWTPTATLHASRRKSNWTGCRTSSSWHSAFTASWRNSSKTRKSKCRSKCPASRSSSRHRYPSTGPIWENLSYFLFSFSSA